LTTFFGSILVKDINILPRGTFDFLTIGASDSGLMIRMKLFILALNFLLFPVSIHGSTNINNVANSRPFIPKCGTAIFCRVEKVLGRQLRGIFMGIGACVSYDG
jgi:hypothetical protein